MKSISYFLLVALFIWLAATYGQNSFGIILSGENTYVSALIFAVILALINLILGTILRIITLPFNFLTLGLFSFLITLLMIYVTDSMLQGIEVRGFIGYIVMAFIPAMAASFVGKK